MNKQLKSMLYVGAASLTLFGCTTATEAPADEEQAETTPAEETEAGQTTISEVKVNTESDITEAVKEVENAVVTVINKQRVQNPLDQFGIEIPDETLDEEDYSEAGTGSGAVYRTDGDRAFIFTNNHVVDGSDAVDVMFSDGEVVEAELVGADEYTDLAVLSIDAEHVTSVAEFGDSESLTLGEPAIAIGSPLGSDFALSVTAGVVSGVNRTVPVDLNGDGAEDWEMTAIQTDAAINPGNSGGPLINVEGQVIGINSMKISTNMVEGMGFAIPSKDAVSIINELETNGKLDRPILGVSLLDFNLLTDEQIEQITGAAKPENGGTIVIEVTSESSAASGDIQAGDVITSFNGQPVENSMQLRQAVYTTRVGDTVEVELLRAGEPVTTTITMEAEEDPLAM